VWLGVELEMAWLSGKNNGSYLMLIEFEPRTRYQMVGLMVENIMVNKPVSHSGRLHLFCTQEGRPHIGSNPITGSKFYSKPLKDY